MKQRLVRVLVYEGDPDWIRFCVEKRWLRGVIEFSRGTLREDLLIVEEPFSKEASLAEGPRL